MRRPRFSDRQKRERARITGNSPAAIDFQASHPVSYAEICLLLSPSQPVQSVVEWQPDVS